MARGNKQAGKAPKYKRIAEGIYRRGDSLAVVVNLGTDPVSGKRKQRWESLPEGATPEDARAKRTELLHQRNKGELVMNPTKATVAEYLGHWLDGYVAQNCDPNTEAHYRQAIDARIVPLLGSVLLAKLTSAHLRATYVTLLKHGRPGGKPLSPRSVQYTHRILSEALSHAVKWQYLSRNVADAVDPPRAQRKEMRAWNADEARRFLTAVIRRNEDGREAMTYGTALAFALETGARRGEVLGLRWRDVDLDAGTIRITQTVKRLPDKGIVFGQPKTDRSRRCVTLRPAVVELLRKHKAHQNEQRLRLGPVYQDNDLVFATALGTPIEPRNLNRSFAQAVVVAGVPRIRLHDLRHTHATLLLSLNVNTKLVSERLGHASTSITSDIYSHVLPGMQDILVAKLDTLLRGAI